MYNAFILPPTPSGSVEQQLEEIRNYLIRTAKESREEQMVAPSVDNPVKSKAAQKAEPVSQAVKDIIVKTASSIRNEMDRLEQTLRSEYVAESDFGAYKETVVTTIEQTAKATIASYGYEELIAAVDRKAELNIDSITRIDGYIQQGFVEYNGRQYFGIAIGENLEFDEAIIVHGNVEYKKLSSGSNVGLYTADGWYFFINGILVGSFTSEDGMLSVPDIKVEDSIQMGDWYISSHGGWGVRYVRSDD